MGFVLEGLYSIIKAAQYSTPALRRPAKRWTMRERERVCGFALRTEMTKGLKRELWDLMWRERENAHSAV